LSWKKRVDKKEEGDDLGSLDLADVSKIKSVQNPDAHDNVNSVNIISIAVRFPSAEQNGTFEEFELDLEAETRPVHKDWLVALGYAVRNIKELTTLSRPEGDPARGNALAAEYMDRIVGLLEQREMAEHLHTGEGHASHAAVASELEAAKRLTGQNIDVNHPVVQASSSLLLKERKTDGKFDRGWQNRGDATCVNGVSHEKRRTRTRTREIPQNDWRRWWWRFIRPY